MAEVIGEKVQFGATFGSATVTSGATPQSSTFSKVDTRLLVDVDTSATSDTGQRATNLTSTSGGAYEATSARLALSQPRTIEVRITADNTSAGTILALSDTAGTGAYRIVADGAGSLDFQSEISAAMTTIKTVALPSVSGAAEQYVVAWSTILDLDQAVDGAATTHLHIFTIYNEDQDTWSIVHHGQANHTAADSGDAFAHGGYWDGAALADTYGDSIHKIRIGARLHSSVEVREDWVATSTAAITEADILDPLILLPGATDADGSFVGWGPAYAGAQSRQCGQRLLSPLVNILTNSPPTLLNTYLPAGRWADVDLDGTTYKANVGLLWHRPIPPMANRARVSVHMQVWDSAASASKTVNVAAVSSNARPGFVNIQGGFTVERYWATGSRTADDTSTGMGDWVTMSADIRLGRDPDGWTWLSLMFQTADANARWKVHAVSFDSVPYAQSNSLPIQP